MPAPHHLIRVESENPVNRGYIRGVDVERQEGIIARLEERWKSEFVYLGDYSFIDYIAIRDGLPRAFVEVITRNYTLEKLDELGGVWLKGETYKTLLSVAMTPLSIRWHGAILVMDLVDGLYWQEVTKMEVEDVELVDGRRGEFDPGVAVKNWISV